MLLQRQRAMANLTTDAGFSPLFIIAQKGNMAMLQLLLEERADVHLNSKDGRTPLYAACENGHDAMAVRLLRLGVAVDAKRTGGSTALVAAVRSQCHSRTPAGFCCMRACEMAFVEGLKAC